MPSEPIETPVLTDAIRSSIGPHADYVLVFSNPENNPDAVKAVEADQQLQLQPNLDPKTRSRLADIASKGRGWMKSKMAWLCRVYRDKSGNPVRLSPVTTPTRA